MRRKKEEKIEENPASKAKKKVKKEIVDPSLAVLREMEKEKKEEEKEARSERIFRTEPSLHILDLRKIVAEKKKTQKIVLPVKVIEKKSEVKKTMVAPVVKKNFSLGWGARLALSFRKIKEFCVKAPQGVFYFTISESGKILTRLKSISVFILKSPKEFFSKINIIPPAFKENIIKFENNFKFLRLSFADGKKIVGFGLIAFVLISPFQVFSYYGTLKKAENKVLDGANDAYASLVEGGGQIANSDFSGAANNLEEAAGAFGAAQREINKINFIVAGIAKALPQGDKLEAGDALFFAGEKFSLVGRNLLDSLAAFTKNESDGRLTPKVKILRDQLSEMLPDIAAARDRLALVDREAIPEDKQETFIKLQEKLPNLVGSFKKLISISDLMIKFLGDEASKRYLFVFQNTGELRPTGGFMGSLALVDFNEGQITKIEVPGGGSYDFRGSLKEKVVAPEPLTLINPRWELQDANWFPDFPTSAEKIKWFYEKGGGPTIDGVVAINSDLIVDLLEVAGPITLPKYNKIIDANNFTEEIQKSVEIEYDRKENKPKQIIGDMAPVLLDKIFKSSPRDFGKILSIFAKGLGERNIILYSVFPEIEHEILNLDWGGKIKSVNEKTDYLMIVHSNLGGGKTDQIIKEDVSLETTIALDGYIKNKLTIKRAHSGEKGQLFTGMRNVDYLRVYAPAGSTLLNAEGFEAPPEELFENPGDGYIVDPDLKNSESQIFVDEATKTRISREFGKTVFANWVQVDPGDTATVILEYILPFKFSYFETQNNWLSDLRDKFSGGQEKSFYQILVQKQPGTKINFTDTVNFGENLKAEWYYGQDMKFSATSATVANELDADRFYLLGFTKK